MSVMSPIRITAAGERIVKPIIALAHCSKLARIIVTGANSGEAVIDLRRLGYARATTTSNCGLPSGQYDVVLLDGRHRSIQAVETTLDWVADFLSLTGSAALRAASLSATMRWLASDTWVPEPKFCRYAYRRRRCRPSRHRPRPSRRRPRYDNRHIHVHHHAEQRDPRPGLRATGLRIRVGSWGRCRRSGSRNPGSHFPRQGDANRRCATAGHADAPHRSRHTESRRDAYRRGVLHDRAPYPAQDAEPFSAGGCNHFQP